LLLHCCKWNDAIAIMELKRRQLCPHESVVIRNTSPFTQLLRFKPAACQSVLSWGGTENLTRVSYKVHFTTEAILDFAYPIEAGEAVTFVFEGGLKASNADYPKEKLLLAVHDPDHGLVVPPMRVELCWEYIAKSRVDTDGISATWERTSSSLCHTLLSSYTAQKVECTFQFHVTFSFLKVESKRCCLIHLAQKNQDTFLYYPHDISQLINTCTKRICGDCCM
jgi:hypothetical protein